MRHSEKYMEKHYGLARKEVKLIAGAIKYAIESGRISGDHDFNAGILGRVDTYENIASDYLKNVKLKEE